jgi:transposase
MRRNLWAGLDVGVETTTICVIDDAGQVLQEATCASETKSIHREIRWLRRRRFARVGLEASGGTSLTRGLRSLGYSVDIYESRQLSKFLRVRRNKTDAGDAIGIAEAGRIGASLVSKVYLKSLECQSIQSRLTIRRHLIRQRVAGVNLLCRQLEVYGGRVRGPTKSLQFRARVEVELRKLFGRASTPLTSELRHLLDHCERLVTYQLALDRELKRTAAAIEVCQRFMEIPGVGPICALTFYATVDEPGRFRRTRDVGCYLGLTPRLHQSGLTSRVGRISRMGNKSTRQLLVQAAMYFLRLSKTDCALRQWALGIAGRSGRRRARVALARKLAVIMLAMWKSGASYEPRRLRQPECAAAAESDPASFHAQHSARTVLGPVSSPEDED